MYWAYCFWLNSTWFDYSLLSLYFDWDHLWNVIMLAYTTSNTHTHRFLINDYLRIKSNVKRISCNWITFSVFHQFFSRSVDGSPSCGTTQFDYYHISLYLVTRIFLHGFRLFRKNYIYRQFFDTSFHFTQTSIDFLIRKFRRIVAQATYCSTNWVCMTNKIDTLKDQHFVRVEDLVCKTGDIFYMHGWFVFRFFFLVSRHGKTYCVWSRVYSAYSRESMNLTERKKLALHSSQLFLADFIFYRTLAITFSFTQLIRLQRAMV